MRYTAEDFAVAIGEFRRKMAGLVRRMSVKLTDGGVWQVAGHLLFDGQRETRQPENYPGIGFAARPPSNVSAEAIVVNVSGQNQPAIVGLRDEATRAKVADIVADEAVMYNSVARVYMKSDGTIEIRTHGGTALSLATKADLQAVVTYLKKQFDPAAGHIHATPSGPTTGITEGTTTSNGTCPAPAGTSKLKGE